MRYVINWMSKEFSNAKVTKSTSTNSVYFYVHGKEIRVSDHLTARKHDLDIVVTRDISTGKRMYSINESAFPQVLTISDFQSLKTIVKMYAWRFRCMHSQTTLKANKAELFIEYVNRLQNNTDVDSNTDHKSLIYNNAEAYFPQWKSMTTDWKSIIYSLIEDGMNVEDIKHQLVSRCPCNNLELWRCSEKIKKAFKKMSPSYVEDVAVTVNEVNDNDSGDTTEVEEVAVIDHTKYIEEFTEIIKSSGNIEALARNLQGKSGNKKVMNNIDEYYDDVNTFMDHTNKSKKRNTAFVRLNSQIGCFMQWYLEDKLYTRFTQAQRKTVREFITENIPLPVILNFFDTLMSESTKRMSNNQLKKIAIPDSCKLKGIVKAFFAFYKETGKALYEEYQNSPVTVSETVSEVVEDTTSNTLYELAPGYSYALDFTNMVDVYDILSPVEQGYIDRIINVINSGKKMTSFETLQTLDVFKVLYSEIWNRLTCKQREDCTKLITVEHLTLTEANYVITTIFLMNTWPGTNEALRTILHNFAELIKQHREPIYACA